MSMFETDIVDFRNEAQVEALVRKIRKLHQDFVTLDKQQPGNLVKSVFTWILKKFVKKRTPQQNKYYQGYIVPELARRHGYDHDTMHTKLKEWFNGKVVYDEVRKEHVVIGGSTADLSTEEFEAYLERIRVEYAVSNGIILHLPNEKPVLI